MMMSGQEKLKKLNNLLIKYYGAENDDDFNQTEYEIISGYVDWLVTIAEKFYPEDDLNLDEKLTEANAYIERQKEHMNKLEEENIKLKNEYELARLVLSNRQDPPETYSFS